MLAASLRKPSATPSLSKKSIDNFFMTSRQSFSSAPNPALWLLRLYVRGVNDKGEEAYQNLQRLCEERIPGCYEIEVIDIDDQMDRALNEGVMAVPMLVRLEPQPVRRMIGNLADFNKMAFALELNAADDGMN
jgi:circadian clock protein KaiB